MTRKEQIEERSKEVFCVCCQHIDEGFIEGAEWADQNPVVTATNTGWPYEKQLHERISKLEKELEIAYTYIEVLEEK
jgi:hypothetical protein